MRGADIYDIGNYGEAFSLSIFYLHVVLAQEARVIPSIIASYMLHYLMEDIASIMQIC